jgi:predicted DNA-binding ribbon-helix-helix protein
MYQDDLQVARNLALVVAIQTNMAWAKLTSHKHKNKLRNNNLRVAMRLTQLEWIKSELKQRSYDFLKILCVLYKIK